MELSQVELTLDFIAC